MSSTGTPASTLSDQPSSAWAPTGQQFEITHGAQRATVVEAGGGLRAYAVGDREILDGYDVAEMASACRGQHLLPWPNRIRGGHWSWDGHELQLPLNDLPKGHAIHGLTRWQAWEVVEHTTSSVTMATTLLPSQGYPFTLAFTARHTLADDGLRVDVTARNLGPDEAPFGYAPHPYVFSGTGNGVDVDVLHVPAQTCSLMDEAGINTGTRPVEGSEFDFRTPRTIGALELDTTWTDLDRTAAGRFEVTFRGDDGPGAARSVTVWGDESFSWVQVFSGDTLHDPALRRISLAIEPMTCPADAFRTGRDVLRLASGAVWTGTWGISPA